MTETPDSTPSLGGTGRLGARTVKRIGYGTMQLALRSREHAESLAMLRAAVDAGVDHLDTAHFYAGANALIGEALGRRREQLTIVSKVGADDVGGRLVAAQKPAQLRAQVEANLAALGTDHLDVVNLRRVDAPPGIVAEGDQIVDLDDQLAELIALREEGRIGAIGLSTVSAEQLIRAIPARIVTVQNLYSLVDRSNEPVLALCRAHGIAWVPYFPLGGAFPGRAKVTEAPVVLEVAAELAATPAQVGLAWLLAHDDGTLLIPGTADPAHLAENIASGDVALSAAQMARLEAGGS